jgi:hypothetical protein
MEIMKVELRVESNSGVRPDVVRTVGIMTDNVSVIEHEGGCKVYCCSSNEYLGSYHCWDGFIDYWEARHHGLLVGSTLRYHEPINP